MRNLIASPLYSAFLLILAIAVGCSGGGTTPVEPLEQQPDISAMERESCSERMLWGIWDVEYDPVEMKVVILPARNLLGHFNITQYVLPPLCDDCFNIAVQGFDTVTRILDVDVTLRNPIPISGYDIRGILYTNDYGHELTNADAWTGRWDITGGEDINPFKAFAKSETDRVFAPSAEHTENYLLYIPIPPNYIKIQFAVDTSWPANCKEPYAIENFIQDCELYDVSGSMVDLSVDVFDWQDDVAEVTIACPFITGEPMTHFSQGSGNTWEVTITNATGAPAGDYMLRLRTSSFNATIPLYQYITITITESPVPIVTGIDPDIALGGANLVDVSVSGSNFHGPDAQVKLKMDGEPDIHADNVVVGGDSLITCDINVPPGAALGLYDVEVTNNGGGVGTGAELFEIYGLVPDVLGIDPDIGIAGEVLSAVTVSGFDFQDGPNLGVALKMDGEPDVVATNVVFVDVDEITCDIGIPPDAAFGIYDVEVTNGTGTSAVGEDLFEVESPVPDSPIDITPAGLNFSPREICIDGHYAYIASDDNGLNIFDLTDPLNPEWITKADSGPGIEDVVVVNGYAYVADNGGLTVFDVSDPASPSYVTNVLTSGSAASIAVADGYAYLSLYFAGLDIIDIDPLGSASVVKNVSLGSGVVAPDVVYDNGYAYVSASQDGLKIVDVDPPESASVVQTIPKQAIDAGGMYKAVIDGDYAYVCDYGSGVHVVDINPPESANIVKTVTNKWVQGVALSGNYAYVADQLNGFLVVDIDPPASANIVLTVPSTNSSNIEVAIYGSYAYMIDRYHAIHIFDISDPLSAFIANSIYTPAEVYSLAVNNGYAYLSCNDVTLEIIDVDPVANAYVVSYLDEMDSYAYYLDTHGDYVYLGYYDNADSDLLIIDVSVPELPSIFNTVDLSDEPEEPIVYSDGYVYACTGEGYLLIADVDPPESAFELDYFDEIDNTYGIVIVGDYAYITGEGDGLQIVDISTPGSESLVNTVSTGCDVYAIDVSDGYAFISDEEDYLRIFDVDPPETAVEVNSVLLPTDAEDIVVSGGYAYVADDYGGLQIVDINPPESAYILTSVAPIRTSVSIYIVGNLAYLGDEEGLQIIQLW